MEWFKHDSNANFDEKLQQLLIDYGLEGYGLYWYCIELIVNKISKDNVSFELKHNARIIARNTGSSEQKIAEMMNYLVQIGLFMNQNGQIVCTKIAKRLSTSATSNQEMRLLISQINKQLAEQEDEMNQSHDPVMKEESRIEEIILDDFDVFWSKYRNKAKKEYARECWNKKKPPLDKVLAALEWQNQQQQWTKDRYQYVPMASTYINQRIWMDEKQQNNYDVDSYEAIMGRALYGK